jgi:hypothetical protein
MMWHDDGHEVWLELNRSELSVLGVKCPDHSTDATCRPRGTCVVDYFVTVYGLEVNVGTCEPAGTIPVAWSLIGDAYDLDTCQVWIIPTTDDVFAAWATTQRAEPE